eukprot:CCRYP_009693-RA/>CCRYP_009693-RA protein AED:0.29 eAED:0.30 QI:0/0/0/1/0/0.14/7/0/1059
MRYPQSAYAGLVNCLQAEWQYLCRVEPGVGPHLEPVEEALRTQFIPALFGGQDPISNELRLLIAQGVKQGGLAIRNPVREAERLHQTSTEATSLLVESLVSNSQLDNEAHLGCVRGAGNAGRKARIEDGKAVVEDISQRRGPKVRKRLERMMETGAWLTAIPDRMSGTELSLQEWHDNISLRYGMVPRGLPRKCDGCGAGFTVEHGLNCKKGGLVSLRHNDVRDEWAHLCGLALGESRVTTEPLIFYGDGMRTQPGSGHNVNGNSLGEEARGDVSAHGFWQRARSTVFDVRITDTDAKSYGNCSSAKLLERFAREKRDKYEEACLERRKDFTPFATLWMECPAARSAERRLASLLAVKWDRQYSEMVNFIRTRMSLSVVPDPIPIDCDPVAVESVAKKLTGAAGCSGVDSALLKSCLLRYGKASSDLREELLEWTLWLSNTAPPWAAYRAMRQGRLVALDKNPGPVGIGECWIRAVSKLVLADCGKEGKAACGSIQLCAGLEAGIEVARRYPQAAYAGLVNCLQAEWQYLCRVEPGVGQHLAPVEAALREKFIPALLGTDDPINDEFRLLLAQGVKQGGLAIRDPVGAANRLHRASTEATGVLVTSLLEHTTLDIEAHAGCVRQAGAAARRERVEDGKKVVEAMSLRQGPKVKKRLDRMKETGAWLAVIPDRFSGTALSLQEWHDNLSLRYGKTPKGLPRKCDGCGAGFTVEHGLSCKKGGLVSIRHDDVRDEWAHLCGLALTSSRVTTEPLIHYGDGMGASLGGTTGNRNGNTLGEEARGDVSAHGFWQKGRSTIFDVRITDTDSKSYGNTASDKLLERFAQLKRDKYEEACLERRKDFTPLCYSVDGMACKAARAAERRLASLLSVKWDRQYSEMVNFIRTRMSLAVVRSNTLLLRSERMHTWHRRAPEDGSAIAAAPSSTRYPQAAYAGLVNCLQAEWQYLCRVEPGVGQHLAPVEAALREKFIPALLGRMTPSMMSFVSSWPKGSNRVALPSKILLAPSGLHRSNVLVTSLLEHTTLDIEAHAGCVRQAGAPARRERVEDGKKVVEAMSSGKGPR